MCADSPGRGAARSRVRSDVKRDPVMRGRGEGVSAVPRVTWKDIGIGGLGWEEGGGVVVL